MGKGTATVLIVVGVAAAILAFLWYQRKHASKSGGGVIGTVGAVGSGVMAAGRSIGGAVSDAAGGVVNIAGNVGGAVGSGVYRAAGGLNDMASDSADTVRHVLTLGLW
jgi:hypothetical protein